MLETLIVYLLLGAVAGVAAGLFGIGGGVLIVPVLVFTFHLQGVADSVATHAAIATSLACIVVTSLSSARAHHRHGAVRWDVFRPLTLGIVLGAYLGVKIATALSGTALQIALGVFLCLISLRMIFNGQPAASSKPTAAPLHGVAGTIIGAVSSLFGIGGGVLTVSYLSWRQVAMQQAVGTSAACGIPIALVGALTNVVEGWDNSAMPTYSLGFVYLPALLGIILTSALCARAGASLAHKLSPARLKQIFAVFLMVVGIQFLVLNL